MSFSFTDDAGQDVAQLVGPSDTLKRAFGSILVDESKLHFDDSGVFTSWVNASNVLAGNLTIPQDALDDYTLDNESCVGSNIGTLQSALKPARVGSDDLVTVDVSQRRVETWINREYSESKSTYHDVWRLLDPDSIREFDGLPELDLIAVEIGERQFYDAVKRIAANYEHIDFESVDDGLQLKGNDDTSGSEVLIHGDVDDGIQSIFSIDLLVEIVNGVKSLQPESVSIRTAEDMPLFVDWARDDGVHGSYMLAPRIRE